MSPKDHLIQTALAGKGEVRIVTDGGERDWTMERASAWYPEAVRGQRAYEKINHLNWRRDRWLLVNDHFWLKFRLPMKGRVRREVAIPKWVWEPTKEQVAAILGHVGAFRPQRDLERCDSRQAEVEVGNNFVHHSVGGAFEVAIGITQRIGQ
jgi:hypothetical protein